MSERDELRCAWHNIPMDYYLDKGGHLCHLCIAEPRPAEGTRQPPNPSDYEQSSVGLSKMVQDARRQEREHNAALPTPSNTGQCSDCDEAAKIAYSDATTPGFFSDKCSKHRGASERAARIARAVCGFVAERLSQSMSNEQYLTKLIREELEKGSGG